MPNSDLIYRPANATFADGQHFANYLDQAAEGFFGFMLGKRSVDILASAFIQTGHDISHQHVTFAEQNQRLVGMVSGYTARQHHKASDQVLKQAAGRYNLRFLTVSLLFAPLMRILDTIADDDFYLQAIALNQELRGQGLGSVLMDFAEDQAQNSGCKRLSLDVSADNVNARKLYERRGMFVESQWPKRLAIPKLRFYRMIKLF